MKILITRVDHCRIVEWIIKDLGLSEFVDNQLGKVTQESLTT